MSDVAQLPDVRRVVTAYNSQGTSVFAQDSAVQKVAPPAGTSQTKFSPIWGTTVFPCKNELADGLDGASAVGRSIVNSGGSTLRIVDTAPGASSPAHRTESLDYVIMLAGEVTLELENGNKTILKAGDVAVQQGTLHTWHNHTQEYCRFACVCLGAEPVSIPNVKLAGMTLP